MNSMSFGIKIKDKEERKQRNMLLSRETPKINCISSARRLAKVQSQVFFIYVIVVVAALLIHVPDVVARE